MSIAHETAERIERPPLIPRRTPQEQRERNTRLIAALDRVAEDDDAEDQRETMAVLRKALGPDRTLSDRGVFKP